MAWVNTKFAGVRYREHKTRKHGIKKDRYFAIRYQRDGRRKEEGLGWASQGWTAEKAALTLAELKNAHKTGNGPVRLAEKREKAKARKEKEQRDRITFGEVFHNHYFPQAKAEKAFKSQDRERGLFFNWIEPVIGDLSLKDVAPIHLEKIKKNMTDGGRSARSIQYCLAVARQVFNFAYRHGLFGGDNPVSKVRKPKVDNRRVRFLTREEADTLLKRLRVESHETWEQALLSLHCGLRASEIFNLTWVDVDIGHGLLTIKDPKNGRTRFAYMTQPVKDMLLSKQIGKPSDLVFPGPDGGKRREISRAFERVVKILGLNDGVIDRRDRIVFHSLRHTYASWLVQSGTDLYVVKERLGHSTMAMTERYAHLAPHNAQATVTTLENFIKQPKQNVISIKRGV